MTTKVKCDEFNNILMGTHKAFFNNDKINYENRPNGKVVVSEYNFLSQSDIKTILSRLSGRTLLKIEFTLYKVFHPNPKKCYECSPCLDC